LTKNKDVGKSNITKCWNGCRYWSKDYLLLDN